MDSILQINIPFRKEQNGVCPCCCSTDETSSSPCHLFLSKWAFGVIGHAGRKHIIPV